MSYTNCFKLVVVALLVGCWFSSPEDPGSNLIIRKFYLTFTLLLT